MPTIIQYPEDLGAAADLQHMVLFFINVRDTGLPQIGGTGITPIAVQPGGAGGPTVLAGGGFVGNAMTAALSAIGAPAASTTLYRLDTAIALHLNNAPESNYVAKYENINMGSIGLLQSLMKQSGSVVDGIKSTAGASALAGVSMLPEKVKQMAAASAKMRINPFKQTYFEEMEYRRFQYEYTFYPKSPAESVAVKTIIDLFKFHMHPELAANTAFMVYPSEFDIMYFWGEMENTYWHRISSCVLEGLGVRYGDETPGRFSSFYGGSPTEIYLQLNFRETEPLTKERILQGY
jgi:hypothetical protein